jgi:hypothetical protein
VIIFKCSVSDTESTSVIRCKDRKCFLSWDRYKEQSLITGRKLLKKDVTTEASLSEALVVSDCSKFGGPRFESRL